MSIELRLRRIDMKDDQKEIIKDFATLVHSRATINIEKNSFDTGFLASSSRIDIEEDRAVIIWDAEYSDIIEYGVDHPFHISWKQVKKIQEWAMRKFGVSERRGYAIAIAIKKRYASEGREGKPFLEPAIKYAESKFKNKVYGR